MAVAVAVEHVADGEDRAAEVTEHDHAVAGIGVGQCRAYVVAVRAEAPLGASTYGFDPHTVAGHLARELREPGGDLGAVRYQYDADQDAALLAPLKLG
jgi:hypothetical protein